LKACAARTFSADTIPDLQTVRELYTHRFESLLKVAGLIQVFQADRQADALLEVNWAIVKDWDSIQRYEMQTQQQAEEIIAAISNRRHGVMKWVRSKW
jgi:hypothetical protein